jgi:hypothetical protein
MNRKRPLQLVVALGLAACCGCGGRETIKPRSNIPEAAKLPKLGDPLPLLNNDRVQVAPPAGWRVPSRESKWLARFVLSARQTYPVILLAAADCEAIYDLSSKNADELIKLVRAEIKEKPEDGKLADPIEAFKLKDFHGVTYSRLVKVQGQLMKCVRVETVADGQRYTLELRDNDGSVEKYRPHLFAVAAGMEFTKGGAKPANKPAEMPEAKPEEKPADPPAPKPEDKPADKPEEKPAPKPEEKPEPPPEKKPEPPPEKKPSKPEPDFKEEL